MRTIHHPLLGPEDKNRFWIKHVQSAVVRTIGGIFMAGVVLLFYAFGYIGPGPCLGGTLSCMFLVGMSVPSLYLTRRLTSRLRFNIVSFLINLFEILFFTALIYFMGGVNAAFLLPCYAVVITRVGTVVPKRYPYVIAALCVLAFALMVLAQTLGFLPVQESSYPAMQDVVFNGLILVTATGFLFGIAAITSFSAGVLKKARDATFEKNRELEDSRKKLEIYSRELKQSEERYRMLIEELRDVVFMVTPEGLIEFTSSASFEFGGHRPEDVEGRHFTDYIASNEDLAMAMDLFFEILTVKEAISTELLYKPKSMTPFYVEISATPIVVDGNVTKILCIMRDISKRKHADEQIRHLNQELMNIQEKERKRIALDLHDDVAQNLASLMLSCETFFDHYPEAPRELKSNMKLMSSVLKQSLTFIRNLSYELRPPGLDQLGLVKTLSRYCEDFSQKSRIHVDFQAVGMGAFIFDSDTEINIYRIVQEALNNVGKHAGARHVEVKLTASAPDMFLIIIDDGMGFDVPHRLPSAINEKRMGIHSMTERVNFMGGKIKVLSKPGLGTTIRVTIPGERFRREIRNEHPTEYGQQAG